ncbi:MAG: aldo/keto reductase, partial [Gammaproteobacteria bacterium]|nr:aldo/keto reductase [Gammaproteobacteria bacterium]
LIALAKDLGINLIDTAPAYGQSEERLGRLLAGQRRDWIISTKVGESFVDGHSIYNFSALETIASVENSLQKLQTDYLDIVLVHSDGHDIDIVENTEVLQTLSRLKEKGLIRCFGLSGKSLTGGLAALALSDLAMVTFNSEEREEEGVIDEAFRTHKGILIKKALASGHTASPQNALKLAIGKKGVSSVIIGTISPKHLEDNVRHAAVACQSFPGDSN